MVNKSFKEQRIVSSLRATKIDNRYRPSNATCGCISELASLIVQECAHPLLPLRIRGDHLVRCCPASSRFRPNNDEGTTIYFPVQDGEQGHGLRENGIQPLLFPKKAYSFFIHI